jgi:hypothetical protein
MPYDKVEWGKGTKLDYEKLNQMSTHDNLIKDKIDLMPRGIIAWSKSAQTSLAKTSNDGTDHVVPGFSEIPFTVGRDRIVSVTVHPFYSQDVPATLMFAMRFDNQTNFGDSYGQAIPRFGGESGAFSPSLFYKNGEVYLTEGDHTLSLIYAAHEDSFTLDSGILLIIEDIGYNYNQIVRY